MRGKFQLVGFLFLTFVISLIVDIKSPLFAWILRAGSLGLCALTVVWAVRSQKDQDDRAGYRNYLE